MTKDQVKAFFEGMGCSEKQAIELMVHCYELEECTEHTIASAIESIHDAVEIMIKL